MRYTADDILFPSFQVKKMSIRAKKLLLYDYNFYSSPREATVAIKFGRSRVEAIWDITKRLCALQHNEPEHKRIEQAWYCAGTIKDLYLLRFGVRSRAPAREGKEGECVPTIDAKKLKNGSAS